MRSGQLRDIFLRALALCYAIAFVSFYVQYDGLLGRDGLLPVDQFLQRHRPGTTRPPILCWYHAMLGCSVDQLNRAVALLGALIGLLIGAALVRPSTLSMGSLPLLYLSLISVGQTFFHFQWDMLLLEAGAAAVVYASPLGRDARLDDRFEPGAWAVRFVLFKLMLMAGMVKLQSDCLTWIQLTALEYHFATQVVATPPLGGAVGRWGGCCSGGREGAGRCPREARTCTVRRLAVPYCSRCNGSHSEGSSLSCRQPDEIRCASATRCTLTHLTVTTVRARASDCSC
jgi:hypothetical protein